jgi:uncharacterized SAM-binding protein YcdF (DUF218 family)
MAFFQDKLSFKLYFFEYITVSIFLAQIDFSMFFILSKILAIFLKPVSWISLFLFLGMIYKKGKIKNYLLWTGLGLLVFFSNPFITNEIYNLWEIKPVAIKNLGNYDIAIILTGVTADQKPRDRVNYTKGVDRVLHTIQLYKLHKIKKILVTGGSGLVLNEHNDIEAENIRKTILFACIPDSDIILEPKAKNTHENALFSTSIIKKNFPNRKYLLVTSAYHMRRSLACFEKEGLPVDPFPVDFNAEERKYTPDNFLPSSEALQSWDTLFKEWFGMLAYKISGYI